MNAKEIQKTLRDLSDSGIAKHSQRFFKTGKGEYGHGDIFLGIRVPVLRQQVKKFKSVPLLEVCTLLKSEYHEERLLALLLLVQKFTNGDENQKSEIYTLYLKHTKYINNWDLVDSSAHLIVGAYLDDKDRQPLYGLVKSNSLWERRIAIIASMYFIRKNDFKDTLKISGELLEDNEDLIHKAVGWMLREVGKRDKSSEENFLRAHYKTMPRTMLRYAIEKFPEEERQHYLKGLI